MLKMNDDLEGALKAFNSLLEHGEYYKAHEVLEEAWHPLRLGNHPLKNLVKGLINAAVAFEHIKRNKENMAQKAQKVIASYERYKGIAKEDILFSPLFNEACQKIEQLKLKHPNVF